jgi:hypothetical protein
MDPADDGDHPGRVLQAHGLKLNVDWVALSAALPLPAIKQARCPAWREPSSMPELPERSPAPAMLATIDVGALAKVFNNRVPPISGTPVKTTKFVKSLEEPIQEIPVMPIIPAIQVHPGLVHCNSVVALPQRFVRERRQGRGNSVNSRGIQVASRPYP